MGNLNFAIIIGDANPNEIHELNRVVEDCGAVLTRENVG